MSCWRYRATLRRPTAGLGRQQKPWINLASAFHVTLLLKRKEKGYVLEMAKKLGWKISATELERSASLFAGCFAGQDLKTW
jgi:hypothetical protein